LKKKNELASQQYADLHTHTVESDGTYTPAELVEKALSRHLCAIAIVDHDTVGAIPAALKSAHGTGLEVIPGVELTAQYAGQEVHILGYFLDYRNKKLLRKLEQVQQTRIERAHKMIENLKKIGPQLDPRKVFDISGKGSVGRMHIARALVSAGWVDTTQEAFRKYIGDKSPAYVLGFSFSPDEAIKLIRDAGGVAVLAHPYLLRNDLFITELAQQGLQGLEVYYPEHSQGMVNFYLDLARKLDLLVTGGSDFHGSAKPKIALGAVKIPLELVERLRQAKT